MDKVESKQPSGNTNVARPFAVAFLENVDTVTVSGGKTHTATCSVLSSGDDGTPESNC